MVSDFTPSHRKLTGFLLCLTKLALNACFQALGEFLSLNSLFVGFLSANFSGTTTLDG